MRTVRGQEANDQKPARAVKVFGEVRYAKQNNHGFHRFRRAGTDKDHF